MIVAPSYWWLLQRLSPSDRNSLMRTAGYGSCDCAFCVGGDTERTQHLASLSSSIDVSSFGASLVLHSHLSAVRAG